jgi:hypothetical protein
MRWQRSKCRCRLSRSRLLSAGSLPCAAPGNREVRSAATVRTLNQPCLNSLAQRCAACWAACTGSILALALPGENVYTAALHYHWNDRLLSLELLLKLGVEPVLP